MSGAIAWIKRLKVDARTWIFCKNKGRYAGRYAGRAIVQKKLEGG